MWYVRVWSIFCWLISILLVYHSAGLVPLKVFLQACGPKHIFFFSTKVFKLLTQVIIKGETDINFGKTTVFVIWELICKMYLNSMQRKTQKNSIRAEFMKLKKVCNINQKYDNIASNFVKISAVLQILGACINLVTKRGLVSVNALAPAGFVAR